MEHQWNAEYPTLCDACGAWLPKGECPGKPRLVPVNHDARQSPEESARMNAYERQFGWD